MSNPQKDNPLNDISINVAVGTPCGELFSGFFFLLENDYIKTLEIVQMAISDVSFLFLA
jgi:hypothetical protein